MLQASSPFGLGHHLADEDFAYTGTFCLKFFVHQKLPRDAKIQAQGNAPLLFLWVFQVVKCEGSYSRKKCFEMEVKSNLRYSLWHHGSPNTFCGELANTSAQSPRTEEGTSWKQPDQELLQMVADDENAFSPHLLRRSNTTSSNLGFIFTAFVKQDGKFPLPKFCLISGNSVQYGSLKGESHTVVIISLFRKPLLNLSDLRITFDATSGEIFDDTSAVSSKRGYCLRSFLTEVTDLFNSNTSAAQL